MVKTMFDVWFDNDFYNFSRMVRDKRPYQIVNNEGSTTIIHNVVGINEGDIKIEIKPLDDRHSYIEIVGESKDDLLNDEIYKVKSRFTVKHNEVEKLIKKIKNGILYLTIKWKEMEAPKIQIEDRNEIESSLIDKYNKLIENLSEKLQEETDEECKRKLKDEIKNVMNKLNEVMKK